MKNATQNDTAETNGIYRAERRKVGVH